MSGETQIVVTDSVKRWRDELHEIIEEEEHQYFFHETVEGAEMLEKLMKLHDEMVDVIHKANR